VPKKWNVRTKTGAESPRQSCGELSHSSWETNEEWQLALSGSKNELTRRCRNWEQERQRMADLITAYQDEMEALRDVAREAFEGKEAERALASDLRKATRNCAGGTCRDTAAKLKQKRLARKNNVSTWNSLIVQQRRANIQGGAFLNACKASNGTVSTTVVGRISFALLGLGNRPHTSRGAVSGSVGSNKCAHTPPKEPLCELSKRETEAGEQFDGDKTAEGFEPLDGTMQSDEQHRVLSEHDFNISLKNSAIFTDSLIPAEAEEDDEGPPFLCASLNHGGCYPKIAAETHANVEPTENDSHHGTRCTSASTTYETHPSHCRLRRLSTRSTSTRNSLISRRLRCSIAEKWEDYQSGSLQSVEEDESPVMLHHQNLITGISVVCVGKESDIVKEEDTDESSQCSLAVSSLNIIGESAEGSAVGRRHQLIEKRFQISVRNSLLKVQARRLSQVEYPVDVAADQPAVEQPGHIERLCGDQMGAGQSHDKGDSDNVVTRKENRFATGFRRRFRRGRGEGNQTTSYQDNSCVGATYNASGRCIINEQSNYPSQGYQY
jgi:hypothetical protein